MNVLVDTNVVLDVLLARAPFVHNSALMMGRIEQRVMQGTLCATTVTTIHYLSCKTLGKVAGATVINQLLQIYQIAPVDQQVLLTALNSGFKDYEDAVLHAAAIKSGAEAIITRNIRDFTKAVIPVYTPEEFLIRTVE